MGLIKHKAFPFIAKNALSLLMKSCTITVTGLEEFVYTASEGNTIIALWHKHLTMMFPLAKTYTPSIRYACVISDSRDGRLLTNALLSYPNADIIKTPHNARHIALKQIIYTLQYEKSAVVITPDGPQGPPMEIKPGIIFAAQKTGATIFPISWSAKHYWKLQTWDSMVIPKPWTHISFAFGKPLRVTGDSETESQILRSNLIDLEKTTQLFE